MKSNERKMKRNERKTKANERKLKKRKETKGNNKQRNFFSFPFISFHVLSFPVTSRLLSLSITPVLNELDQLSLEQTWLRPRSRCVRLPKIFCSSNLSFEHSKKVPRPQKARWWHPSLVCGWWR